MLLMMTANLVGFVVGIDGAKGLWKKMLGTIDGEPPSCFLSLS